MLLAVGLAFHDARPTRRRAFAELVAWHMAVRLQPVPMTDVVDSRSDRSPARRGTPGGYFGAVVFTDPGTACDLLTDPVGCGAKLEVYRDHKDAARRADLLRSEGERIRLRGVFLLRAEASLAQSRWSAYVAAFQGALVRWKDLSNIADTGSEAPT